MVFKSDLTNYSMNESFILINTKTPFKILPQILGHQLIHYFQWNTGRSKRQMKKEFRFNQNEYEQFKKKMKYDPKVFLTDKIEFSPYVFQFFSIFKQFKITTIKFILDQIFEIFSNKQHQLLDDYLTRVKKQMESDKELIFFF